MVINSRGRFPLERSSLIISKSVGGLGNSALTDGISGISIGGLSSSPVK